MSECTIIISPSGNTAMSGRTRWRIECTKCGLVHPCSTSATWSAERHLEYPGHVWGIEDLMPEGRELVRERVRRWLDAG